MSWLIDDYPDTFAAVQIHWDDAFEIPWGDNRAEVFYDLLGTPTAWFDGVSESEGTYEDNEQQYNLYRSLYLARRSVPTDFTLDLGGAQVSGERYAVTALIKNEGPTTRTVKLQIVQVLDYYPIPPSYSRNCLMQAATGQVYELGPGESECAEVEFEFQPSWNHDNIKIIAWVQEPGSGAPAEVHQAAQMTWPFAPLIQQDFNNDGEVDLLDYGHFSGCMTGPGAPSSGACENAFDSDEDGDVDLEDFTELLAAILAPHLCQ